MGELMLGPHQRYRGDGAAPASRWGCRHSIRSHRHSGDVDNLAAVDERASIVDGAGRHTTGLRPEPGWVPSGAPDKDDLFALLREVVLHDLATQHGVPALFMHDVLFGSPDLRAAAGLDSKQVQTLRVEYRTTLMQRPLTGASTCHHVAAAATAPSRPRSSATPATPPCATAVVAAPEPLVAGHAITPTNQKDAPMNTSTSPADRLRQQLDHIHTVGRQLGADLIEHLDIADLLTLPDNPETTARLVERPFRVDFLADLPDPDDDWSTWETELLPDRGVSGPLARNRDFWTHLYVAIESHVLAGADEVHTNPDGSIDVIADCTTGFAHQRPARPGDQPPGVSHIGQIYLANGELPDQFAVGIAAALRDVRAAVR